MNATTNYQLSQWEAEDRVLRTDFNADNAKIEAALSGLEARVALLDRAVPNLAYQLGAMELRRMIEHKKYPNQRAMIVECFLYPQYFTLSGGVTLTDGVLTLTTQGVVGHCERSNSYLLDSKWSHAEMWLRFRNARVTPIINGLTMTAVGAVDMTFSASIESVQERKFILDCQGSGSARVAFDMECVDSRAAQIYDYSIFFF